MVLLQDLIPDLSRGVDTVALHGKKENLLACCRDW